MQTILNSPLASPSTPGISAAASFGAALGLVLGVHVFPGGGNLLVTGNAFAFALLASMMVYLFSQARGVSSESMVLVGIAPVFHVLLAARLAAVHRGRAGVAADRLLDARQPLADHLGQGRHCRRAAAAVPALRRLAIVEADLAATRR